MVGTYSVCLGRETVGQVIVERKGLYYRFCCRCKLHSNVMCRVSVICGSVRENLGILSPLGSDYVLTKEVPVKRFREGIPEFLITPKQPQSHELCIDIYPEEPFQYIAKLEKAYLDRREGRMVIRLK